MSQQATSNQPVSNPAASNHQLTPQTVKPDSTLLPDVQSASGATFGEIAGQQVATSFGEKSASMAAHQAGVLLFDRSHWSLLEISGPDRLDYLHNQTTNNIKGLSPGQGCNTCIVTPTARLVDLVTAYVTADSVLLLASPSPEEIALKSLSRLIAFSNASLANVSDRYTVLTLVGTESVQLLSALNISQPESVQHAHHSSSYEIAEDSHSHRGQLRVARGTDLAAEGYTLIVPEEESAVLWQALVNAGAIPCGTDTWETLRIVEGRPALAQELTQDYNPLEAGLWHSASFTKGCYVGQETIARLETYNGVKQQLWGIELKDYVDIGSTILVGAQRAGTLTSITLYEDGYRGLGYIRTKVGGEGLDVNIGNVIGKVIPIPYSTRKRQPE